MLPRPMVCIGPITWLVYTCDLHHNPAMDVLFLPAASTVASESTAM